MNNAGQITITIENQDQFLHLHNNYLLIEVNVLKADDTRYADADLIALTNNGLLYQFPSLKLTLADQTVDHVNYPGQATSLHGDSVLVGRSTDYCTKSSSLFSFDLSDLNISFSSKTLCKRTTLVREVFPARFQKSMNARHGSQARNFLLF